MEAKNFAAFVRREFPGKAPSEAHRRWVQAVARKRRMRLQQQELDDLVRWLFNAARRAHLSSDMLASARAAMNLQAELVMMVAMALIATFESYLSGGDDSSIAGSSGMRQLGMQAGKECSPLLQAHLNGGASGNRIAKAR